MSTYRDESDGYTYIHAKCYRYIFQLCTVKNTKKQNYGYVSKALKDIIKVFIKIGHKSPNLLHVGKGFKLQNKEFNLLLTKFNIKLYDRKQREIEQNKRYNQTQDNRIKDNRKRQYIMKAIKILDV